MSFVSMCQIQGMACGAAVQLALSCDIIIATNNAKFSLPALNSGQIYYNIF